MSLISVISSMARGVGGVYTPPEPEMPGDLLPPSIVSLTATSATNIRAVFNEPMLVTLVGWEFNNGSVVVPSSVTPVSAIIYDFTVSGLDFGQSITASYNMVPGSTSDMAGNELISFSSASVINNITSSLVNFQLADFEVADFT